MLQKVRKIWVSFRWLWSDGTIQDWGLFSKFCSVHVSITWNSGGVYMWDSTYTSVNSKISVHKITIIACTQMVVILESDYISSMVLTNCYIDVGLYASMNYDVGFWGTSQIGTLGLPRKRMVKGVGCGLLLCSGSLGAVHAAAVRKSVRIRSLYYFPWSDAWIMCKLANELL